MTTLYPYQSKAVDFILSNRKCALYLDMGLGKTIITLSSIVRNPVPKILIIAPYIVAKEVWHHEISKWEHTRHLTWSICLGSKTQRLAALHEEANIYLINVENVAWLSKVGFTKWDLIILDESSSFKSSSSKRFKALRKFKYEHMIQLTGTPNPNSLLDLWSQIYLLDGGERLGKTMQAYKDRFFISDYMGYNYTPINPQLIYDRIADITLSMKAEDYLELPSKIDITTYVDVGDRALYNRLKRDLIVKIESDEVIAANAAVLSGKMLQFCNGAIYDETGKVIDIHDNKLDALELIIDSNPNDNILVAYNFKSDLQRILKRFPHAEVLEKEGDIVQRWNDGRIKLLLCQPASCSKGLNLQQGGHIIVWFGLTWSLENYLQFNGRLHRQGQNRPVVINHIVAKGCIDEYVLDVLTEKRKSLDGLLDFLKV